MLALGVYLHRLRENIGAYCAILGGIDALVFTPAWARTAHRSGAVEGLAHLGVQVDEALNTTRSKEIRRISPDDAPVAVLVVPTDEELQIARHATAFAQALHDRGKESEA